MNYLKNLKFSVILTLKLDTRGYSLAVGHHLAKVRARVRISLPAPGLDFYTMQSLLSKITRKNIIREKIERSEAGLYFYLVFPIAFAFVLTFSVARIFNLLAPDFYLISLAVGHVHHYVYGFFVLAVSGYLALIFDGPRAKYLISLLHGLGLGLAFDEFAFWLKLTDADPARWSYDGFLIVMGLFFFIISAKRGLKMLKILWPFNP